MKLKDLDYFRTKDNILFLVKGYYHLPGKVFAYPVFWPDKKGDYSQPTLRKRFSKETSDVDNSKIFNLFPHYRHKLIPHNIPLVPEDEIIEVYHPQDKVKDFLKKEKNTIWFKIFNAISKIGKVTKEDIGIFGSYLVGFSETTESKKVKDIDFCVYGINNCLRLKNRFNYLLKLLGYKHISKDHIAYHARKFGPKFDPKINSFKKTLSRKWSSIQIREDLLSTIRFVYKDDEIPPNPIQTDIQKSFQITGEVVDDFGTNFMPRTFLIKKGNREYRVVTYFWGFQEAVKNGDLVMVTGDLHQDQKTLSVDRINHGIKLIN